MMSYYADRDSARVMLSRAEVVSTSENDDDLALITVRGFDGEVLKNIHRMQQMGDAYRPMPGAHGMLLSSGGRRDQAIFFGGEQHDKRPRDLEPGERAVYNSHGEKMTMRNGHIETVTNGRSTTTTGGDCTFTTGGIFHINP